MKLSVIRHLLKFAEENDVDFLTESLDVLDHMIDARGMTEEEIEESIPTAINRSVTKVSYRPHEGHESVFYFIIDENGLKIELEKIEGNHKITGYRDFCFNSMEKETMALGKEVEVSHIE